MAKRFLLFQRNMWLEGLHSQHGKTPNRTFSTPVHNWCAWTIQHVWLQSNWNTYGPGAHLSTSMSPQSPDERKLMEKIPYLSAVGTLQYLATSTCPDISFAVGVLACFNTNPGIEHWKAVKHLFWYLKDSLDYKLIYGPTDSSELFITYTDADHGG